MAFSDLTLGLPSLSQWGRHPAITGKEAKKGGERKERRGGEPIMCFSPACRWVGWQHYIQCHPSQHRRSRPHTSPLASGSLAHMRWCTGFMEGGRDREDGGIKQWAKVDNKEESRASKHKYLWLGKTNKTHDWNWKPDTATEKVFFHIFSSLKKGGGRQFMADKSVKNQRHGDTLLMHAALVFFPPRPGPGELPRHSLPPRCLQWNKVKLVWRQLQLPFGHASLNHFKYTLTCAHPLMGATKIARIFFQLLLRTHTNGTKPGDTHKDTMCCVHWPYMIPLWMDRPPQLISGFSVIPPRVTCRAKGWGRQPEHST